MFNPSFWQIDVPRAAAVYPSMWHAGIALAASNLSVKQANIQPDSNLRKSNHYYREALTHFNKSIKHLSKVLQERDGTPNFSYMDKEMLLMTNILYFGVVIMLNDPGSIASLHKHFILLLDRLRFGDDEPAVCRGIMGYDELLAVVLCIDGCGGCKEELQLRYTRPWAVKVPSYESYKSTAEAYIDFLPLVHWNLKSQDEAALARDASKPALATRLAQLRRFERKLTDLLHSLSPPTREDREAIEYMQHYVDVQKINEQSAHKTNRLDVITEERKLLPVLDYIDRSFSQSSGSYSSPGQQSSPPVRYSHYSGYLLERIVSWTHSEEVRRRSIDLMRKWPYVAGNKYNYNSSAFYEAVVEHELAGPTRTRASQLAGHPIIPEYVNGGLIDRVFDGTRHCECIPALYVCSDHRLGSLRVQIKSKPRYFSLASVYEVRHNLGFARYYLDEIELNGQRDANADEVEYRAADYLGNTYFLRS